ncbi:MAG: hypothetical protein JW929_06140 [Anaerolineales bacterium]|nr:hypothetical protein [Anaerolineales bacterium]
MRFPAIPGFLILALVLAACGAQTTAAPPTAAGVSTDLPSSPSETPEAAAPTETPSGPGSISGAILTPEAAQPATSIRIYAREKATARVYPTEIPIDQTNYTISGLPLGTYTVFAWYYPDGVPGAYTSADVDFANTSSEQLRCSNSLIEIVLTEAQPDFQGADISCWAGDYFIYLTPIP